MGTELDPLWNVRVDDADDPLAEVKDPKAVFAEELLPQILMLPTRDDPWVASTTRTTN